MKTTLTILSLISVIALSAQDTLFFDDFENGTGNWILTGTWGLNTDSFYSPGNSFTESPVGNYPDQTTMTATMVNGVDLSNATDAYLSFWAIYSIEFGFDYMYVEISTDNGNTWVNITQFSDEDIWSPWQQYVYSLGGFVGNSNVKVRFRFASDAAVNKDGMYIDDFLITSDTTDNSPPLIMHTPPEMEKASLDIQQFTAELIDISGISTAELYYRVDQGSPQVVSGIYTNGNTYLFTVPAQSAGAWVEYWIKAVDGSSNLNTAYSDTMTYISGNYLQFDSAQIDFVNAFASYITYKGCAVRITLPGTTNIVTELIRNYTDITRPNDSMEVHIWNDAGGVPGTDLITPFKVFPEATLAKPNRITRIDLRPYSSQLSGISGDVYIGFIATGDSVWVSQTTPGYFNRTFAWTGSSWFNLTDDYMFRLITDTIQGAPVADFTYTGDPTVVFTDQSLGNPSSWYWDFDDGNNSSSQNPAHTYTQNGNYNVCLTVANNVTNDTYCQLIAIDSIPPVADFNWDTTSCPTVYFTDQSTNNPTSWYWDFGDGNNSASQNPSHTYTQNGNYNVMFIAGNAGGYDTVYMQVPVTCIIPPTASLMADSTDICKNDCINFTDLSIGNPTAWLWTFQGGNPSTSTQQNPSVICYPNPGLYEVTLIAYNQFGSDTITIPNYIHVDPCPGIEESNHNPSIHIAPNPMRDRAAIISKHLFTSNTYLRVYDIVGNEVAMKYLLNNNRIEIYRSNLPPGMYLLSIFEQDAEKYNGKIFIQ